MQLATFSGSNPDSTGTYTYTCSGSGCDLAASTGYFTYMRAPGSSNNNYDIKYTAQTVETRVPSSNGWYIGDRGRTNVTFFGWTDITSGPGSFKIRVTALPKPTLTAGNITSTTATLTLTNYAAGDWWYQGSQIGATCTQVTAERARPA